MRTGYAYVNLPILRLRPLLGCEGKVGGACRAHKRERSERTREKQRKGGGFLTRPAAAAFSPLLSGGINVDTTRNYPSCNRAQVSGHKQPPQAAVASILPAACLSSQLPPAAFSVCCGGAGSAADRRPDPVCWCRNATARACTCTCAGGS